MGRRYAPAPPPGSDPHRLVRFLHGVHDDFLATGHVPAAVRGVVADSWRRSLDSGVDPESAVAPIRLNEAALADLRTVHPLAPAMPVVRRLLLDAAVEAGLLVAVSDAEGRLLWVEGSTPLRSRAESMNFVPGADWSETSAGTNAPGTALALGKPVSILGAEHLSRPVTPWSCSAAPVRDPVTGSVLGVLDLTGGPEVVTTQTLGLVRATVAAVEAELRLRRLDGGFPAPAAVAPRLDVLGRRTGRLTTAEGVRELSLRHSEILLLVAGSADGLTTGELGVALSGEEHPPVTIRAELSRLRALLGPVRLGSRPYRVLDGLDTDVAALRRHLAAAHLRQAVAAYAGPLLPASTAPAVEDLRAALHDDLRAAVLAAGDADTLLALANRPGGRTDYPLWAAAERRLPPGSARRAQVSAHLARLDALLA